MYWNLAEALQIEAWKFRGARQRNQPEEMMRRIRGWTAAGIGLALIAVTAISAPAQTLNTVFTFDGTNGDGPQQLVQGRDGNYYGVASLGGPNGEGACAGGFCGTIFKITPTGVLTTLHAFDGTDGAIPVGPLVLGTDGNFYGGTRGLEGGSGQAIFRLTPAGEFTELNNSYSLLSGPIQATDGNFYWSNGAVFRMTPAAKVTELADFGGSSVIQGTDGFLYGVSSSGGTGTACPGGCGTVFRVSLSGVLAILHSFNFTDGAIPLAALVQGADGNFYGTTTLGGAGSNGTIFKITPAGKLATLHSFSGDGVPPFSPLVQTTDGNFYGTTGDDNLFRMTPAGTVTTVAGFDGRNGINPVSVFQATNGVLYGTTYGGVFSGNDVNGTIFSFDLGLQPFVSLVHASGVVGQTVQVLGQGFTGATGVSFNGTAATTFSAESDTFLTAVVPAGATAGSITVTEGGATLTSNKPFLVLPQIKSFTPASGPVGTKVVIDGESFTGTTVVSLDCTWPAEFTVDSDTQITFTIPENATTGGIGVRTSGGHVESVNNFIVTP
jgi:uncharacterized repeat protein (TIGR03803 family)